MTTVAKLFEGENLAYEYVPIELDMDWKSTVSLHDLAMMESIALHSLALARNTNIVSRPLDENAPSEKTRFQVTRDDAAGKYRMVFSFPLRTQLSLGALNRIHALFPNKIIQEDTITGTNHRLTSQDLVWSIWMHTHSSYDRAEYLVLHATPTVVVTHVYPEPIGKGNEGRGVKRQRPSDDSPAHERVVKSRKEPRD